MSTQYGLLSQMSHLQQKYEAFGVCLRQVTQEDWGFHVCQSAPSTMLSF
jgi:hypothetical protein